MAVADLNERAQQVVEQARNALAARVGTLREHSARLHELAEVAAEELAVAESSLTSLDETLGRAPQLALHLDGDRRQRLRSMAVNLVRGVLRKAGAAGAITTPISVARSSVPELTACKVYLASRYARRDELRAIAAELEAAGNEVTSRWLFVDASVPEREFRPGGKGADVAGMDLEDLGRADVCISFSEDAFGAKGRGGRHVECGVAIGLRQRIILVGPREHVFHCLPQVEQYESWEIARVELLSVNRVSPRLAAAG